MKRKKKKTIRKSNIKIMDQNGNIVKNALSKEEQKKLQETLDMRIRQTVLNAFKGNFFDFVDQLAPGTKKRIVDSIEKQLGNNNPHIDSINEDQPKSAQKQKKPKPQNKTSSQRKKPLS